VSTKTLRTLNLRCWSGFEAAIQKLENERQVKNGRLLHPPLFRGHGSNKWKLETTLERSHPSECGRPEVSFLEYYRTASAAKPVIETLSGKTRRDIPDYPTFMRELEDNTSTWLDVLMFKHAAVVEYFVLPSASRISVTTARLDGISLCCCIFCVRFTVTKCETRLHLRAFAGPNSRWVI